MPGTPCAGPPHRPSGPLVAPMAPVAPVAAPLAVPAMAGAPRGLGKMLGGKFEQPIFEQMMG